MADRVLAWSARVAFFAVAGAVVVAGAALSGGPRLAPSGSPARAPDAPDAAPAASLEFHSAWVDQSPWPTLVPGSVATYTLRFRNTGTATWQRGVWGAQVNLGIGGDDSSFSDLGMNVGWLNANRLATTSEATVPPGAVGTFTFQLRAPLVPGTYRVPLHPVLEGAAHLEDEGVYLMLVSDFGFHSAWVSQSPYPALQPGETSAPISLVFRNTGARAWRRGVAGEEARLGVVGDDRSLAFLALGWPDPARVAVQTEATVDPGATATFSFRVKAPQSIGRYVLPLRLVVDGVTWLEDQGVFVPVTVGDLTRLVPVLTDTVVQSGLSIPWDLAFAPDGRMFVTERAGRLRVYASGAPGAALLGTTTLAGVHASGEAGLMGIALDPDFARNGYVYVCASRDDEGQWRNQVLRYRAIGNTVAFDDFVIRRGMVAASNHDGCRIRFGPDGKLWVTMGEAGNGSYAQDPNSLNGKVLRVNWDGAVPADNPILPRAAGRSVVYTMGHRNPQGLTFQPGTGVPFAVEHGPDCDDEINVLVAGANYGWPNVTGSDGPGGYADPVWASGCPTLATSGGTFVSGPQWGAWSGSLFVATLKESDLRRFAVQGTSLTPAGILYDNRWGRLRAAVQGPDGSLYLTTSNGSGDRIIRITPALR